MPASCHAKDDKGNLSRISWIRTTPEGWEEAIKRMVRLNGLTLEPADARVIVKYLSNSHGLAPEEAKPVMYMAEHRIQDEVIPNESVRVHVQQLPRAGAGVPVASNEGGVVAAGGHALGAVSASGGGVPAQRRRRRRSGGGGRSGRRWPRASRGAAGGDGAAAAAAAAAATISLDATLDFLGKNYPLHTPEWAAWRARMRAPKIAGQVADLGAHSGHGQVLRRDDDRPGRCARTNSPPRVKLQPVNGGPAITRTGTGLVYAGYSWRGRSKGATLAANAAPDDLSQRDARSAVDFARPNVGRRAAGSGASIRNSAST